MLRLKRLIHEIHSRSLWQVLGIYAVASWLVFEVVQTVTEGLGLPHWLPAFAALLLLVGLPIVIATAFVQEGFSPSRRHDPTLMPGAELEAEFTPAEVERVGRLFTWRNAIGGGVVALALWGIVATGWYVLYGEATGGLSVESKSVAVLPFANMSADPENEYFSDGITETIINHLSKIADLKVISRTSVMQYKQTDKNLRQIADELGVATVLEGSVQRAEDRVQITAQLIDAESDDHLWAEQYNRQLTDIFAIQTDVARNIVGALQARLGDDEKERIEQKPTDNLEAYSWYLRGNQYYIDREEYRIAIEQYEKAVELDPTFALAYARLAMAETELYWFVAEERTYERLARARQAVDIALQLDPDLPEAHMAMGLYYYWGHLDYERALSHLLVSQAGLSGQADGFWPIATVLRRQGEFAEAAANYEKAFELNPRIFWLARELAVTYYYMRDYEQAEALVDQAMELAPDQFGLYLLKAVLYLSWKGNREEARQVLEEAWRTIHPPPLYTGNDPWQWWVYRSLGTDYEWTLRRLASGFVETDSASYLLTKAELHSLNEQPAMAHALYDSARVLLEGKTTAQTERADLRSLIGVAYAGLGRKEEAIREAKKAVELLPPSRDLLAGPDWVAFLARVYVMVGEHDAAIDQLEYLLSTPGWLSQPWLQVDPVWDPLRDHPRFQALQVR
jgi:serine/threonine-protein kinase